MDLGQYASLGEYFGPHTASSVFLILVLVIIEEHKMHILTRDLLYKRETVHSQLNL